MFVGRTSNRTFDALPKEMKDVPKYNPDMNKFEENDIEKHYAEQKAVEKNEIRKRNAKKNNSGERRDASSGMSLDLNSRRAL
ncbi:uncharacterized protein LOC117182916 isoform X2 [Belonocnema kinseyi]|uniref:uncharacterized protein LOC117182916 isoform X2 n=1 Tax=Belonocnema kinseyi TaxID=2817044 RepID=UPI00143D06BA|nr:uncharacterized protein LOC117182916 isoform X2 [Belonocnema kinseyi]